MLCVCSDVGEGKQNTRRGRERKKRKALQTVVLERVHEVYRVELEIKAARGNEPRHECFMLQWRSRKKKKARRGRVTKTIEV